MTQDPHTWHKVVDTESVVSLSWGDISRCYEGGGGHMKSRKREKMKIKKEERGKIKSKSMLEE
jgi:hypothetical protein